jgi:hypothetical protein
MSKRAATAKKPLTGTYLHAAEINFLQTDAYGIVISASEQLSAFTGRAGKDLVGTPLTEIVGKRDISKLTSFLKQ